MRDPLILRFALMGLRPLEAWINWSTRRYIRKHHGDPRQCIRTGHPGTQGQRR